MLLQVELLQSALFDPIVIGDKFDQRSRVLKRHQFGNIKTCPHKPYALFGRKGLFKLNFFIKGLGVSCLFYGLTSSIDWSALLRLNVTSFNFD
jgi:hypothetical protein